MKTFNAFIRGEDRTEFTISVEADSCHDARLEAEELYPEGTVIEVFDPVERAEDNYHRMQNMYDDPYRYDNYDWC